MELDGDYYIQGTAAPSDDTELEKHKKAQDEYEQKEASVHKVVY